MPINAHLFEEPAMNNINPPYISHELWDVLRSLDSKAVKLYLFLISQCLGLTRDYEASLSMLGEKIGERDKTVSVPTMRKLIGSLKTANLISEQTKAGTTPRYRINPLQLAIDWTGEPVHSPTPPLSQTVATPQTMATSKAIVKQIEDEQIEGSNMLNDELLPTNEPLDSYPVCDSCGYTPPIGATQGLIDMVRSELNRYGVCQSCYSNQRKEARFKTKSPTPTH